MNIAVFGICQSSDLFIVKTESKGGFMFRIHNLDIKLLPLFADKK